MTLKRNNLPDNVEVRKLVKNQIKGLKRLHQKFRMERESLQGAQKLKLDRLGMKLKGS